MSMRIHMQVRQRCQMLLRRVAALGEMSERLVVTCHAAQNMPALPASMCERWGDGEEGGDAIDEAGGRYPSGCYDRIICDVPCSGDGSISPQCQPEP